MTKTSPAIIFHGTAEEEWKVIDVCFLELDLVSYSEDELIENQRNDDDLIMAINVLQGETTEISNKFRKFKNKLKMHNDILKFDLHGNNIFVVPKEMRAEIICQAHGFIVDILENLRHKRLLETIWWPYMLDDIKEHIQNCNVMCSHKKGKKGD